MSNTMTDRELHQQALDALGLAINAMRHPLNDWKGEVERKALDSSGKAYVAIRERLAEADMTSTATLDRLAQADDLIVRFGRGVTDMFEQMHLGNWEDDMGHKVTMNKKMLDLMPIVQAAIDYRAIPRMHV